MKKRTFVFCTALLFLFSLTEASAQNVPAVTSADIRLVPAKTGGGFHLYIRKKGGVGSVLLTESAKDPAGKTDNYAYRAFEWNNINGDEMRVLNGKKLTSAYAKYSLIDSTAEKDEVFGKCFHIYIPEKMQFGYPWTRHGTVTVGKGVYINIRTFADKYADYRGGFRDNPFIFNLEKKYTTQKKAPSAKSAEDEIPEERDTSVDEQPAAAPSLSAEKSRNEIAPSATVKNTKTVTETKPVEKAKPAATVKPAEKKPEPETVPEIVEEKVETEESPAPAETLPAEKNASLSLEPVETAPAQENAENVNQVPPASSDADSAAVKAADNVSGTTADSITENAAAVLAGSTVIPLTDASGSPTAAAAGDNSLLPASSVQNIESVPAETTALETTALETTPAVSASTSAETETTVETPAAKPAQTTAPVTEESVAVSAPAEETVLAGEPAPAAASPVVPAAVPVPVSSAADSYSPAAAAVPAASVSSEYKPAPVSNVSAAPQEPVVVAKTATTTFSGTVEEAPAPETPATGATNIPDTSGPSGFVDGTYIPTPVENAISLGTQKPAEPEAKKPAVTYNYSAEAEQKFQDISKLVIHSKGPETITNDIMGSLDDIEPKDKVDVVFTVDATGSMKDDVARLRKEWLPRLPREFKKFGTVRVGLVLYSDYGEKGFDYKGIPVKIYNFTDDLNVFDEYMNSFTIRGDEGGDIPEAVYEGLFASLEFFNWDPEAAHKIILIGDAEPHPEPRKTKKYSKDLVMQMVADKNVSIDAIITPVSKTYNDNPGM